MDKEEVIRPSGFAHAFDVGIATQLGIHAAIVLNHILHWIRFNAAQNDVEIIDGRIWMFQTQEKMAESFGYMSVDEVKRAVVKLLKSGILIAQCNSKNRWNRTLSYSTSDTNLYRLPERNSKNSYERANSREAQSKFAPSDSANLRDVYKDNKQDNKQKDNNSLNGSCEEPDRSAINAAEAADKRNNKSSKEFSKEVKDTCESMCSALKTVKDDYKTSPIAKMAMSVQIDLMMRVDKRTPEKILAVFLWAVSDSFWSAHVFKPNPAKYLREKFDQLEMKMNTKPAQKPRKFLASSSHERAMEAMRKMDEDAI